jgi:hypothetical protein
MIIPIPIIIGNYEIPLWMLIPIGIIYIIMIYVIVDTIKENGKGIQLIGWSVKEEKQDE